MTRRQRMRLELSADTMDIGTFAFNFVRTLMVAGTGGAELNECLAVADRIKDHDAESWTREWALLAERVREAAERALREADAVTARQALLLASNYYRAAMASLPPTDPRLDRY